MLKNKRGAVLPFVLVAVFITQFMFLSFSKVYENQMQTYILLENHYQSQTILRMAEISVAGDWKNSLVTFNIGVVRIEKVQEKKYNLTSRLTNGYGESRVIDVN